MNSDDKAHSDSESGSPHSRAAPSAHSADAIANLLRAHSSSTSTPHIGDALVLSGISGVAPIDGVALLSAALDNMPAEPNDLNQARLGLRILASAGKEQQTPSLAESQDLAKLALEIIDAVDLADKNQAKVHPVAFRVYDLIRMLVDVSKAGATAEVRSYIPELERDLSKILDVVKSVATENMILHLMHPHLTSQQLAECDAILDGYVDKIKTSLLVRKQYMLARQDTQLAELTVSKAHISDILKDQGFLSSSQSSGSLPLPPTHFVGRDDLVRQGVEHILLAPGARVIILGLGGMGKTCLALATVHADRVQKVFGDKTFFVSCEGFKSGLDLALAIIFALGGGFIVDDEQDVLAKLSQQLLYAGKILLVIDNFETLWLESTSLPEVQRVLELIASVQSLALIVTMRGDVPPYTMAWSLVLPPQGLGPLTLDAAKDMFRKSSHRIDSALRLESEHNLDQLLLETDCIPLVISLLSVLQDQYTCTELYARWCSIKTELLQIPNVEKTKTTSVAVSIELSLRVPAITECEDATRLLSIIAFLPEGIPHWDTILEDLITSFADPYEAVDILCRAALVFKSSRNSLTMLSPTRHYIQAQRKFNSEQLEEDLESIFKFMKSCMLNQSDKVALLGRANMLEILIELMSFKPSYELAKSILQFSEYLTELKINMSSMIEQIIPRIEDLNAPNILAEYFLHHDNLLMELNLWAKAEEQSEKAYKLYSRSNDQVGMAKSLQALGHSFKMQSNYEEAIKNHNAAYEIYLALDDQHGLANALKSIGTILRSQGQYSHASEKLNSAYQIYSTLNNIKGMAIALKGIGNNLRSQKKYAEAIKVHQSAYELFIQKNYQEGIADSLICIGDDLLLLNQYKEAIQKHSAAFEIYNSLGNELGMAASLDSLGDDLRMQGQYAEAAQKHNEAFVIFERLQYLHGMGNCLHSMANNLKMQHNYAEANQKYKATYQIFDQIGNKSKMAQIMQNMEDMQMYIV